MSIIVAVKNHLGAAIGSDGRACLDTGLVVSDTVPKLRRADDGSYAVGVVGAFGAGLRFLDQFSAKPVDGGIEVTGEMTEASSALALIRNGKKAVIYSIDSDGAHVEHENYFAKGSGDTIALGALHVMATTWPKDKQDPAAMVKQAIKTTAKFINTCGGKVTIYSI